MINHWWVTRPKRRLDSIPEILVMLADNIVGEQWDGARSNHLSVEDALEQNGLKRTGERRDQGGSGARTYIAWLKSYGLVFEYKNRLELTLAGEAIVEGKSPVEVLKTQIIRFQYPSPFSLSKTIKSRVTDRFKIRPFRFLLKLLSDPLLDSYLSEEELGYIIIEEAEDESDSCYKKIVNHILDFRDRGMNSILPLDDFNRIYSENVARPWSYYMDIANTMFNVLEYTQLIIRYKNDSKPCMRIADGCHSEIQNILSSNPVFIRSPEDEEYFQRKYGVGPYKQKDTRNLDNTRTVTQKVVMESKIKTAFIARSLKQPIYGISNELISSLVLDLGSMYSYEQVEDIVRRLFPQGAISGFYSNYYRMAFSGKDKATDFEAATDSIFKSIFGFNSKHIGQQGRVPDVIISSDSLHYQCIIDNKAYSEYTVNHDHFNRMVHTYIPEINRYAISQYPLKGFCYIAGGFGKNITQNIMDISNASGVNGSALSVSSVIKLIKLNEIHPVSHGTILNLMNSNKLITPDLVSSYL